MIFEILKINHFIILSSKTNASENSFFQGFSRSMFQCQWILNALKYSPNDLYELYCTKEEYLKSRMCDPALSINFIEEQFIPSKRLKIENLVSVIWSNEDLKDSADLFSCSFQYQPILINLQKLNENEGRINISYDELIIKLRKQAEFISQNHSEEKIRELFSRLIAKNEERKKQDQISFTSYAHNLLEPSLLVLESYGYKIDQKEVQPTDDIGYHIEKLVPVITEIDSIRNVTTVSKDKIINDAMLYCTSIFAFLYNFNSSTWRSINQKLELNKFQKEIIKKLLIRIKTYSSVKLKYNDNKDTPDIVNDPKIAPLICERRFELELFTSIISIFAKSQFLPSIRLPHSVMLHHDILHSIANLIHAKNLNRFKLNKKFVEYSASINHDFGKNLINLCFSRRKKILAICDFPLEWISFDTIPLMFTHEISRVGTTPGNLLTQQLLSYSRLYLPYKKLCKILIIRSYPSNDSIKNVLEDCINFKIEQNRFENLDIQIKDVNTKDDIVKLVNSFDGGITIFDCHGGHGGVLGAGTLLIGEKKIDIWELSGQCKVSPIIILSACSTHPIDGSHASVANGFFKCGALSVLGTFAPVDAMHSGVLVMRILHRISHFLPLNPQPITWRKVISGFFRLSYINDVLRSMVNKGEINSEQSRKIEIDTGTEINMNIPDWENKFFSLIAKYTSKSEVDVRKHIHKNYQFTETMLYTQLGRPENIIIYWE